MHSQHSTQYATQSWTLATVPRKFGFRFPELGPTWQPIWYHFILYYTIYEKKNTSINVSLHPHKFSSVLSLNEIPFLPFPNCVVFGLCNSEAFVQFESKKMTYK